MNKPVRAYAKINLGLLIHDRRPDGYHEIETLFHLIDLFDELRFEKHASIEITVSGREVPVDERNLCYRAAATLRDLTGFRGGVRIYLTKNIPVGAGLGGGSSDAASVLHHLPGFWGLTVSEEEIRKIAPQIGSDVAYFLRGGTAIGTGRGEILSYIPLDIPHTILVCHPNIHVSTSWAYQRIAVQRDRVRIPLREHLSSFGLTPEVFFESIENDFEEVVFAEYPEIANVKRVMLEGGATCALLSGSGSAVFGLFPDPSRVSGVSELLKRKNYGVWLTPPHFTAG